jgi:hypothetical protein
VLALLCCVNFCSLVPGYGSILSGVFFFCEFLFDEVWASLRRWGVGSLLGHIAFEPLYYVIKVLNFFFNLDFPFEWHMESEGRSDEVPK